MIEITKKEAIEKNLKFKDSFVSHNLSQTILLIKLFEETEVKYYSIELMVLNEETQNGEIYLSFWNDTNDLELSSESKENIH